MRRGLLLALLAGLAVIAGLWWFAQTPERETLVDPPAAAIPSAPGIPADAFEMTVESVHDGDTLRARVAAPNAVVTDLDSTRVRLLGIDTPEISDPAECWGDEATERLRALLPPGSTVWAAPDREALDQYDRHLLYLWTPDGRFVNAELVAAGDARVMVYAPNDLHAGLLRTLEAEASTARLGLWGACG